MSVDLCGFVHSCGFGTGTGGGTGTQPPPPPSWWGVINAAATQIANEIGKYSCQFLETRAIDGKTNAYIIALSLAEALAIPEIELSAGLSVLVGPLIASAAEYTILKACS